MKHADNPRKAKVARMRRVLENEELVVVNGNQWGNNARREDVNATIKETTANGR